VKKLLVVGLIVGLVLGVAQIFFVRTTLTKNGYMLGTETCDALTAACGYCPGLKEENICYTDGFYTRYRGFPLASKSGEGADPAKLGVSLYANMALFILGIPLLLLVIYKLFKRRKRQPKAEIPERTEPDSSV
jgi:hypothetical protein